MRAIVLRVRGWRPRLTKRAARALLALGVVMAWAMLAAFGPLRQEVITTETLIVFVVSLIAGALGEPLIDFLKHKAGFSGTAALIFAYVVSIGIAAAALFLTGALGLADFTGEAFFIAMGTVISTANFVYKLFNPKPQTP